MYAKEIVAAMYRSVREAAQKKAPLVCNEITEARRLCTLLANEYTRSGVLYPTATALYVLHNILTMYNYE